MRRKSACAQVGIDCNAVLVELEINRALRILGHNRAGKSMVGSFGISKLHFQLAGIYELYAGRKRFSGSQLIFAKGSAGIVHNDG